MRSAPAAYGEGLFDKLKLSHAPLVESAETTELIYGNRVMDASLPRLEPGRTSMYATFRVLMILALGVFVLILIGTYAGFVPRSEFSFGTKVGLTLLWSPFLVAGLGGMYLLLRRRPARATEGQVVPLPASAQRPDEDEAQELLADLFTLQPSKGAGGSGLAPENPAASPPSGLTRLVVGLISALGFLLVGTAALLGLLYSAVLIGLALLALVISFLSFVPPDLQTILRWLAFLLFLMGILPFLEELFENEKEEPSETPAPPPPTS